MTDIWVNLIRQGVVDPNLNPVHVAQGDKGLMIDLGMIRNKFAE